MPVGWLGPLKGLFSQRIAPESLKLFFEEEKREKKSAESKSVASNGTFIINPPFPRSEIEDVSLDVSLPPYSGKKPEGVNTLEGKALGHGSFGQVTLLDNQHVVKRCECPTQMLGQKIWEKMLDQDLELEAAVKLTISDLARYKSPEGKAARDFYTNMCAEVDRTRQAHAIAEGFVPNVAGFWIDERGSFHIMQEYSGETSHVKSFGSLVPEVQLSFLKELFSGVKKMHSLDLLHTDIKPSNICIKEGHPALIDWGKSIGTPEYWCPGQGSKTSKLSDRWATIVSGLELVTGSNPIQEYLISQGVQVLDYSNRIVTDRALMGVLKQILSDSIDSLPSSFNTLFKAEFQGLEL